MMYLSWQYMWAETWIYDRPIMGCLFSPNRGDVINFELPIQDFYRWRLFQMERLTAPVSPCYPRDPF